MVRALRLFAGVTGAHFADFLEDLFEVVAGRVLERRVIDVGEEFFFPEELADGEEVPVVDVGGAWGGERAGDGEGALLLCADVVLEGIALDVLELGPVVCCRRSEGGGAGGAHHGVVELPVLVADGGGETSLVVEEGVAIAFRFAGEVGELVKAIELGFHDAIVFAVHDLLIEVVVLGSAGDLDEGGEPIEGGEHVFEDGSGLDDAGPADDAGGAHAAFPGGEFTGFEGGDAAVGVGLDLGAVVGGEDDDGVVELAHVFEFFEDDADVVVHLLHAGFVGAPVFSAFGADHVFILFG